MLFLPLFVFLKVLAGKWGPAQLAEAPLLLKGWWGGALWGFLTWESTGEQAFPFSSFLCPTLSQDAFLLIWGQSSYGSPAATGGEAATGGGLIL